MIGLLNNLPKVTKIVFIINCLVFLMTVVFGNSNIYLECLFGGFYPLSPNFRWWQIFTHMFLHGSVWHIFFNMFALIVFGSAVEIKIGRTRFITLYFLSGFSAFLFFNLHTYFEIHSLLESLPSETIFGNSTSLIEDVKKLSSINIHRVTTIPQYIFDSVYQPLFLRYVIPMIGASGAIYGVLIMFGICFPNEKLIFIFFPIPIKAKYFILILMMFEFGFGIINSQNSQIAHFAHIGGAIMGLILAVYWKKYAK